MLVVTWRSRQSTEVMSTGRTRLLLGALLVTVAFILAAVVLMGRSAQGENLRYASALQAAIGSVPEDSHFEKLFTTTVDGHNFEVFRYRIDESEGIQILEGNNIVTEPDTAFGVLLSYAWLGEDRPFSGEETAILRTLASTLQEGSERYALVFGLANGLAPVVEAIDHLQDIPILGVPRIEIRGFPILEVNNAWDLLCVIPINATDLCLLEPLVREMHDQGLELQQLVVAASADLDGLLVLLEESGAVGGPSGLALKQASERSVSSLNSLERKLDEVIGTVEAADELARAAAVKLRDRQWGARLGGMIGLLGTLGLGVQVDNGTDALAEKLESLDKQLTSFLTDSQSFSTDIGRSIAMIEEARLITDQRVLELGRQWRLPPPNGK